MEIQLVHTTGSPSRHDSDSESSFDRNQISKSSSEMALHRKQSRRCKKQMSERQRRKRMNNSMDKLGLLVYGKTFKDGLKVDKATLLKDAYEKLQTMKDDYSKGYETAISSTQDFLERLHGCPQEVKDALQRHLHHTLQVSLQQCHSTTPTTPSPAGEVGGAPATTNTIPTGGSLYPGVESSSDSGSPRPVRSRSVLVRLETEAHVGVDTMGVALQSEQTPFAHHLVRQATPSRGERGGRAVEDSNTTFSPSSVGVRALTRTVAQVAPLGHVRQQPEAPPAACRPSLPSPGPSPSLSPPSSRPRVADSLVVLGQQQAGAGPYGRQTFPAFSFTPTFTPKMPPSSSSVAAPKIKPYVTPYAPQNPLYLGSTPPTLLFPGHSSSSSTPPPSSCSSYAAYSRVASQALLTLQPVPAPIPAPAHSGPALTPAHTRPAPAHALAPARADDSGYISPVVPSPMAGTPSSVAAMYAGHVKKRYLRQVMLARRAARDDSDEENDKEVEQVLSRAAWRYDSDTASSSQSD